MRAGNLAEGQRRQAAEGLMSGLILQALLLISGILAARLLGPEDRGLLALVWVTTLILAQVGCLGLPIAVTYELARGGETARSLFRMLWRVALAQVVVLTTVLGLALILLAKATGLPTGPALISLGVLPAMVVQSYGLAVIQGRSSFRSLHVLRLSPSAGYAIALVVGAALGHDSLMFVTSSWAVSFVAGAVLTALAVHRIAAREPALTGSHEASRKEMLRFGYKSLLGYISPTETFRLDQLLVGLVLSVHDLGLYVAALAICNLPRFLAQGLGLVAYPAVAAAAGKNAKRRLLWKYAWLATAVAACVATPMIIFAHDILDLAFGAEFSSASTTAQILLGGTIVLCGRRLMADGLRGAGAPGAGSLAEVLSWIWVLPALVILVPTFGLIGVATALASSYVITATVLVVIAYRRGLGAPCSLVSLFERRRGRL